MRAGSRVLRSLRRCGERAVAKMAPHESAGMASGAGAAMTEACHVPLDRRGTPRTCRPVAEEHGRTNRISPAPPARRRMRKGATIAQGRLVGKERTPNIPIRKSDERAPDHREPESCCRRHKLMTAPRCNRVQSSNSIPPAVTGRSARSTRSQPSFAAKPLHRVIAIARTICEWRVILSFKYHRRRCSAP